MITDEEIPMMPMFGPEAKSLIKGLLNKDVSCKTITNIQPESRLGSNGIQEIKQHEFFYDTDWDKIQSKLVKPPFVPVT